jgi:hypothetical protein
MGFQAGEGPGAGLARRRLGSPLPASSASPLRSRGEGENPSFPLAPPPFTPGSVWGGPDRRDVVDFPWVSEETRRNCADFSIFAWKCAGLPRCGAFRGTCGRLRGRSGLARPDAARCRRRRGGKDEHHDAPHGGSARHRSLHGWSKGVARAVHDEKSVRGIFRGEGTVPGRSGSPVASPPPQSGAACPRGAALIGNQTGVPAIPAWYVAGDPGPVPVYPPRDVPPGGKGMPFQASAPSPYARIDATR